MDETTPTDRGVPGIALEDRRALECLCPDGFAGSVRCTGGGATSTLWNQIRAEIFAHPVQTLSTTEGGTQGAAIASGAAVGARTPLLLSGVADATASGGPRLDFVFAGLPALSEFLRGSIWSG